MAAYIEPLLTADKILKAFNEDKCQRGDYGHIVQGMGYQRNSPETKWIEKALDKLKVDGFINADGHSNNQYSISGAGTIFIAHGGYENKIANENRKEEIIDAIQQSGLKTDKNIQETNVSIVLLNKVLKPTTIVQAITAFVMLIVAGVTLWVAYLSYKESKAKDEIIQRLKSLEEEQGKIKQNIQQLQLPIEKDTVQKKGSINR